MVIQNKSAILQKYRIHLESSKEKKKVLKEREQLIRKIVPYNESLKRITSVDEFDILVHNNIKEKIAPIRNQITFIDN